MKFSDPKIVPHGISIYSAYNNDIVEHSHCYNLADAREYVEKLQVEFPKRTFLICRGIVYQCNPK